MSTNEEDPYSIDPERLQYLVDVARGFGDAKVYSLVAYTALVYDHILCLGQESEYFWRRGWSMTKALYFMNRAIPLTMFSIQLSYMFSPTSSPEYCSSAIRTVLYLQVVGMVIVEVILAARVYHLWSHMIIVQVITSLAVVLCVTVAVVYAGILIGKLKGVHLASFLNETGCLASGHARSWPIFLPLFVIETVLCAITILRVLRPLRSGKNVPVASRLLRDGVLFYVVVFLSMVNIVSKSLEYSKPRVSLPALLSNSFYATHSICASHLILSIHSLAAELGSDPRFLLSNVEISRVMARSGSIKNEIIVEVKVDCEDSGDNSIELYPLTGARKSESGS